MEKTHKDTFFYFQKQRYFKEIKKPKNKIHKNMFLAKNTKECAAI
jgi:hypothetical protein